MQHAAPARACAEAARADVLYVLRASLRPAQTRGAVRDSSKLSEAAFWYKAYVAAAAAAAEQAYERDLLATASRLLATPLLDALPAVWNASGQAWRDAFDAGQMRNATCLCGSNATALLAGTVGFADEAAYLGANCSGERGTHGRAH